MKFTLAWLKEHLDTNATLAEIAATLTSVGLEVEHITDHSESIKDFSVAEIIEAVLHPDATKLRVCKVNDGQEVKQIVCGAPNARPGIKVVLAQEGVRIPGNGLVIKKSMIRGVESNGMLCSGAELGLSEESDGIIELPQDSKVGSSAAIALGLDDPVIEIAITPNRADCLGVRGIARDLAAAGLGSLKDRPIPQLSHNSTSPMNVRLETPACPLFIGCLIHDVTNTPSPDWLQNRLNAIGLRPISALVDITNYMTYTYGRPLHVFDADKIQGDIIVRYAQEGETFKALNDKEYTLDSSMVAVCDARGVLGLGGVIGGALTGCSPETKNVFLEAALFDAVSIASTGRKLSIDSDARYRFERGVDPAFVKTGAEIAIAMILELCGGQASELVIAGSEPRWERTITFDRDKLPVLGGITLPATRVDTILSSLGFHSAGEVLTPPSWRSDIEGQADIVEEILRINGYDAIPSLALPGARPVASGNERSTVIRKTLALAGLTEICSWAFIAQDKAELFGSNNPALQLLNPISVDLDVMRPSLLPNLLSAVSRNTARGFSSLALFEMGNIFTDITPDGQKMMVAGIRSDTQTERNVYGTQRPVDLFDAKADLFVVLETAGLNPAKLHIDRKVPGYYHPTRSGRISLGGKVTLGYFGEIHPLVASAFDIKQVLSGFETYLDAIPVPKVKNKARPALVVSNFPAVERDFAFLADSAVSASEITRAIENVEKILITSVAIFDVYSGKGVEEGKKSVAISVTLQANDKTLSEADITLISQKIIASVAGLGLVLRS